MQGMTMWWYAWHWATACVCVCICQQKPSQPVTQDNSSVCATVCVCIISECLCIYDIFKTVQMIHLYKMSIILVITNYILELTCVSQILTHTAWQPKKLAPRWHDTYIHICPTQFCSSAPRKAMFHPKQGRHSKKHLYVYVCMYICMYMYDMYVHICMYEIHCWILCTCIHAYAEMNMHVYIYTWRWNSAHEFAYSHACQYVCACAHL